MKLRLIFGLMILTVLTAFGLADAGQVLQETKSQMGTTVTIMIWTEKPAATANAAMEKSFGEIDRINGQFSNYLPDTPISRINAAAGKNAVEVDDEVMAMLKKGVEYYRKSKGAFDITFAGAGRLYDYKAKNPAVPTQAQIDNALENVGIEHLKLDEKAGTAKLDKPGCRIDLGGYIKGYAVDRASAVLKENGIDNFIVNAGGDMYVSGAKGETPWRVGIRDPRAGREDLIATVSVRDKAVVTSGDYERFFIKDGKRHHHILNPKTGRPADTARSVTIVADKVMDADALSTSVFVLDPMVGLGLVETLADVECFMVDGMGRWLFTHGFKETTNFKSLVGQ